MLMYLFVRLSFNLILLLGKFYKFYIFLSLLWMFQGLDITLWCYFMFLAALLINMLQKKTNFPEKKWLR